ncbi:MAG TPA: DUF1559 domain-containing protein, partial [Lacipirellulaceae bacterium]|nr:DUF1559 domain-containing protein [Lacipirellulaceae bacterium]
RMGMGGATPQWLTELRAEHPVEREMTIGYIDVAGILERVRPLVEAKDPKAWPIIERLGLTSIKAVHAVGGYDATGCVSMVHLATDGTRPGLLQFIPHKPLEQDDLAIIPKDALAAMAISMDLGEAIDQGVALISQFEPRAREDYDRTMWEIEAHLGVNVRDEVLATVGDAWVVYLPGGDLMSSWLNSAAAVRVKDPARLRTAAAKLIEAAKAEMARNDERVSIVSSDASGNTIYSLQFQGEPIPFAPSRCISDRWMVVGLLPQAVQAAVDRQSEDSLAESESLADAFSGERGPSEIFYQDTPQVVRSAYPFVQMGVQMASSALRNQGITIDTTALPSAETIVKHLRPTVTTLEHEENGFHLNSRGSLPGGSGAVGTAPFLAGLLVPAVGSARTAARDAQEQNHLKQLALGFLNYESAQNKFVTDVFDPEGKPLLSWRVQLLPYMEEMALYQLIRKDEPWDSEHNRQFHDLMPEVFRSPSSEHLTSTTRFLAFRGPQTLMPGNQQLRIQDVADGTSNTVLFVQAHPDAAVNWMQPDDLDFNPEHPFAGLSQPAGFFLAAFCDGSVRRVSLGIGDETMKALVSRNGGEMTSNLEAPPMPELYDEAATRELAPVGAH